MPIICTGTVFFKKVLMVSIISPTEFPVLPRRLETIIAQAVTRRQVTWDTT